MVFHRTWISTIELGQLPSESWGLISTSWALSTGLFPISSGYWIQNPHVCMTCTLSSWAVFPAVLCFWQIYIYGYTCICLYMFLLGHLDKMVSLSQQSTLSLITAFDFVYFICCIVFLFFTWKDFHPFAFTLYATLQKNWIFFMRDVVGSPFWSFQIRFVSLAGQIPLHSEEFPLGHCAVFLLTCGSSVIIPLLLFNFIVWWFFCCFILKFSFHSHFCIHYHFLLCIHHSLLKVL